MKKKTHNDDTLHDMRDHIVLKHWADAQWSNALLFMPWNDLHPFVSACGYDPATKTWSSGTYFDDGAAAWNHANPAIAAHLSEPVFLADILEDMVGAGCEGATMRDAAEYAMSCRKAVLPDADQTVYDELDAIRDWWECRK